MFARKFLRELRREAERKGLKVTDISPRGSGHFAVTFEDEQARSYVVTVSGSPTNQHYVVDNALADVRRLQRGQYP